MSSNPSNNHNPYAEQHVHMKISEHRHNNNNHNSLHIRQSPAASLEGTSKLDIALPRGSRNTIRNQYATDDKHQKSNQIGGFLIDG